MNSRTNCRLLICTWCVALAFALANMGCKRVSVVVSPEGEPSTASAPTLAASAPATDGVPRNRKGGHVTQSGGQSTHESSKEDLPPDAQLIRDAKNYMYSIMRSLGESNLRGVTVKSKAIDKFEKDECNTAVRATATIDADSDSPSISRPTIYGTYIRRGNFWKLVHIEGYIQPN